MGEVISYLKGFDDINILKPSHLFYRFIFRYDFWQLTLKTWTTLKFGLHKTENDEYSHILSQFCDRFRIQHALTKNCRAETILYDCIFRSSWIIILWQPRWCPKPFPVPCAHLNYKQRQNYEKGICTRKDIYSDKSDRQIWQHRQIPALFSLYGVYGPFSQWISYLKNVLTLKRRISSDTTY